MTPDRLQAAWRYTGAEVWRPLFDQFRSFHPDLPIEVVRTMLDPPRGMPPIFVEPNRIKPLDVLRTDVAKYLDQPNDARAALRRIKPQFFVDGRAVATALSQIAIALEGYESQRLSQAYQRKIERLIETHALPCRLESSPLTLVPFLNCEVDALYSGLRERASSDPNLNDALTAFEKAWDRQSADWDQINAREAIRTASLLAENMLVSATTNGANDFSRALEEMRHKNRFPSNDFANIFARAYNFVNTYPNIRHAGDKTCVKRDLRRQDAVLAVLVFMGLSACAHELCSDGG